jgi:carbon storage regulator CsrA
MLILTRRPGEAIIVGDDITFTVLGLRNRVRAALNCDWRR